jgi:hypothetical protein
VLANSAVSGFMFHNRLPWTTDVIDLLSSIPGIATVVVVSISTLVVVLGLSNKA